MPVFDSGGDIYNVAGAHFHSILFPFLIKAAPRNADKYLSAALFGVVDMPVVPASGFKSHVEYTNLFI